MTQPQLVGPDGRAVTSRELAVCPRCEAHADKRQVITAFGGWWKRVCECGHVYDQGQGVPPLED